MKMFLHGRNHYAVLLLNIEVQTCFPFTLHIYVSPKLKSKQEDWHQFRGNWFLTGRSLLKGNILYPQIKWKNLIGARETLVNIQLSNNLADELVLPNTNTGSFDDTLNRWNFGFPLKAVISINGV